MSSLSDCRLPDFLIVGAMKSGTTTVFRDLETQRQVFFPVHKEPHKLCYDAVLTERGQGIYASLFREARPDQLCGEASTGYTKIPVYQGVPQRAREVLGPDLKIIYRVREPVARTLSHHFHLYLDGAAPANIEDTLRTTPELISFSRYAMQIEPWIETFGRQQVHIGELESYARDRRSGLRGLCEFLGFEAQLEFLDSAAVFHAAKDGWKFPGWLAPMLQRVIQTHRYRFVLRPLIPDAVIARLKRLLLKPAPPPPPPPRLAVIDEIIDGVRDDAERLAKIMDRREPLWDFEAVRAKYAGNEERLVAAV